MRSSHGGSVIVFLEWDWHLMNARAVYCCAVSSPQSVGNVPSPSTRTPVCQMFLFTNKLHQPAHLVIVSQTVHRDCVQSLFFHPSQESLRSCDLLLATFFKVYQLQILDHARSNFQSELITFRKDHQGSDSYLHVMNWFAKAYNLQFVIWIACQGELLYFWIYANVSIFWIRSIYVTMVGSLLETDIYFDG